LRHRGNAGHYGLAYNGYRNKQRSNRALQAKQGEINKQNLSLQQLLKEKNGC